MLRFNDSLRHAERRLVFDLDGLRRLAAQSVGRSPADVVSISKLAEGGFNRTFLITLHDDFQMVARIPYPATVPKYYAVASEAATVDFLRSSGLPVPQIYGYSPESDNAAGTEYILMEFVRGMKLSDVWLSLGEQEVSSVLRQLTQLESMSMSLSFPAGGSLYYTHDLEKVERGLGIPLEDERFCVGPDTRLPLWYGRRSQLDINRGPCTPLSVFIYLFALELTNYPRQKRRSNARSGSPQGIGLSGAVRPTALTIPAREEGWLPVPGTVAVGPHREFEPLSPHRVVTRPWGPGPQSFLHSPSRPPAEQYRRSEITQRWLASRRLARLATRLHLAHVSPCRRTPTPPEPR